ncbi:hypothetical protein I316_07876 [Kwoniella heveanensis BCC8398]|uniref:DUF726-domain-containing protein n=1 Tax=Kwoniella heveanensis BCC8398 TaxID=1296120 RepID=A0A1B9GHF0_9TREE|nr:hypothetical protein I316_07876 [Kwoniella heveanensis BCC8398]
MPVVRSDDNPYGLDEEDQRKFHYRAPARLDPSSDKAVAGGSGNATGQHLEVDADTLLTDSWRDKAEQDESDYTRLRLDEDEESEEVAMRTKYLFDEDKAMTPLSQMQATKNLLTEGQRIAYVGLCQLIAKRMLRDMGRGWEGFKPKGKLGLKGKKADPPAVESGHIWMLKIMARLYQHMELTRDEQRMIESLAEHGVDPSDLVPALMTTHTVDNPDFDPKAKEKAELEAITEAEAEAEAEAERDAETEKERLRKDEEARREDGDTGEAPPPPYSLRDESGRSTPKKNVNPFGEDDDDEAFLGSSSAKREPSLASIPPLSASNPAETNRKPLPFFGDDVDDDDGDIASMLSPPPTHAESSRSTKPAVTPSSSSTIPVSPGSSEQVATNGTSRIEEPEKDPEKRPQIRAGYIEATEAETDQIDEKNAPTRAEEEDDTEDGAPAPLPSLPGVSTSLSNTDEMVTLDIRWTVLCDLFLVLIADSVYDARSRAFLERVALELGFGWSDLVRFENRVTDALEIQEGVEKTGQETIIEGRMKAAKTKRYALMGLAAVGGGLVIGLSAGLAAPLIGAGLGAALGTVGITGTGTFLAGAGGVAMITTGGVLTGANIAGKGMARRTREVRTFEFRPLHNNKRVSCYITMGGFMASTVDDVRLPFSVLDPIVGDVYSILWEPEMMAEMGSALKILTGEILTQVGQQVLSATIMTALMSALQWPIILTKLGYLIDNPWSNALDRARAAGLVLADTIIHRHAGVRPISLIGFSLGARAIFYALIELARVKAYGLVQDVFLFGTTVTASRATWLDVRSVVAGRFVNGYATNDWMLGYLFRATSGGLNTVAGLRPVESVAGLENVDVTELITGHMSYRSSMPQLLAKVGFPVTSDYFDEPEDPNIDMSIQERRIVNEAEEEAKRSGRKILGIFPRKNDSKGRTSTSGTSTPVTDNDHGTRPVKLQAVPGPGGGYEYEDDDDLPPREEADLGQIPGSASGSHAEFSKEQLAIEKERESQEEMIQEQVKAEQDAVKAIPKTAGFDFAAISKELGKEIDLEKLSQPEPRHAHQRPPVLPELESRIPLERSGSAPPPVQQSSRDDANPNSWSNSVGASTSKTTSVARFASPHDGFGGVGEDEDGDITATMNATRGMSISDLPSWERPNLGASASASASTQDLSESTSPLSPSASSGLFKSPVFSWNAWNSGSGSNAVPGESKLSSTSGSAWTADEVMRDVPKPVRAAPPARPHPAEFMSMSNPFAVSNSGGSSSVAGLDGGYGANGWKSAFDLESIKEKQREQKRKEEEDMAESNPW